ncbi:MAG: haloacid dehalogenase type II, partial [Chloroflexi bacterium]|nr:haloacid dehalogenase type II [Chloroflexota bacterium]
MTNAGIGVKAMVFDAYGTLFDVHSVISLCNELFPDQGPALSQLWRAKQLEYTWLLSLMGRYEDFWEITAKALRFACRALTLPLEPDRQARLVEAYLYLETYPEVHQALTALADYPLAILSNGSPPMLAAVVSNANLQDTFAHVISVDEVKIFKPSPQVYRLVVDKLGLAPETIGFVSSNSFDIIGATAFGFRTFWVNRAANPLDELGFTPTMTINKLTDLVEI